MILVTGANGLIGSHICKGFSHKGYETLAMVRESSNQDSIKELSIKTCYGDITDIASLETILEKWPIKTIIHTAAIINFNKKDKERTINDNVKGTANIVDSCLKYKIKNLLFISSVAAIGNPESGNIIHENCEWSTKVNPSPYAISKYLSEKEVHRGQAEGLNTIIVNPSIVLGIGDLNKSSNQIFKYVQKNNLFYTTGLFGYVDVRDIAKILILLYQQEHWNTQYILSAGSISYQDFFQSIAIKLQVKGPRIRLSSPAIKSLLFIKKVFPFLSFIPDNLYQVSKNKFSYSSQKIIKKLSYQFHTIDESISWVCNSIKPMQ